MPMLLSVSALAHLGTVLDFENGQAVFKKVAPDVSVQLGRTKAGHLLLDMSQDLVSKSAQPLLAYSLQDMSRHAKGELE